MSGVQGLLLQLDEQPGAAVQQEPGAGPEDCGESPKAAQHAGQGGGSPHEPPPDEGGDTLQPGLQRGHHCETPF